MGPDGGMDINSIMDENIAKIFPQACMTVLTSDNLSWNDVSACAKQFLKVSDNCINCIPQFGDELKNGCESTCEANIYDFAGTVEKMQGDLESKLSKKSKSFGGFMPSESDMMDVAKTLQSAMTDGMKTVIPCAECFKPKATNFVKCMMGDQLAKGFEAEISEMIDEMKSGNWAPELVPMGPNDHFPPMPMGSHGSQRTVPF